MEGNSRDVSVTLSTSEILGQKGENSILVSVAKLLCLSIIFSTSLDEIKANSTKTFEYPLYTCYLNGLVGISILRFLKYYLQRLEILNFFCINICTFSFQQFVLVCAN